MSQSVLLWAVPVAAAFESGCSQLYWTDDTLYWIAKPRLGRESGRFHCATGPAIISDLNDEYYWRGTHVPPEWIRDKSLTAATAITWPNIEQRRVACEIVGWDVVLEKLGARVLDDSGDPEIGQLIEVQLPDAGREKFLRVMCGTKRQFALPVPPNMRTALEAQAWGWSLPVSSFVKPEVRT